ncbi:MAG: dTDP-4-dehydrorhamnose reductase [Bacteroidetes bacterium]|nr:dTDP-4-dehydrorhamnose reductase [Bacteroidota bacterium]
MQRIIVTGAGGQLGRELQALAAAFPALEFVFADRGLLSIDDPGQIASFFDDNRCDWCINCAAYTAVDKAETEKEAAFRINGDAPGWLARACKVFGARLIHISTDYVFDGSSSTPLREDDRTAPINTYGASKLEGEENALREHRDGTLIIRTSWVYSEFGNNFVKTMMRLMGERPAINVVNDQIGSPTYAADLAAAILHIVAGSHWAPGIYNYSNEGIISWYDFALAIRVLIGSSCQVNPIPSADFPTPARRPRYSLLDKTLIKKIYGLTIPDWRDSLEVCISRLQSTPKNK